MNPEPWTPALRRNVSRGDDPDLPGELSADVVIVGSGAGGGTAAEILQKAGLQVLLVEEGDLRTAADFSLREEEAYETMFQEVAGRKTTDTGINIFQGKTVGGSTTVNWTSSFRTPSYVLRYWQERFGVSGLGAEELGPWFEAVEKRLHIQPWAIPPNMNNQILLKGARATGVSSAIIPRNVHRCQNLGLCGVGCPANAKQSMLITSIPAAVAAGTKMLVRTRADSLVPARKGIRELRCRSVDDTGRILRLRARHFVVAAGGIGSAALMLRSGLPDPHDRMGRRTFLHPSVISVADFPEAVAGYYGAPQSVYSDHYMSRVPWEKPREFKLETVPVYPLLYVALVNGIGEEHVREIRRFPNTGLMIALLRDGFHSESEGGLAGLDDEGGPVMAYPYTEWLQETSRDALLAMARLQFAAGAKRIMPVHRDAVFVGSLAAAEKQIGSLTMDEGHNRMFSAHVMGGCGMGEDPRKSVVNSQGRHHQVENLSVLDGSVFPTSLGVNPQVSIYAVISALADRLARDLG